MKLIPSKVLTVLRIGAGLGLLAYLGFSGAIDWSAMARLAAAWEIALAAVALELLASIILAWRLCLLYRPHGIQLTLAAATKLTLVGLFFSNCLPGAAGGDVVKIYYATRGNHGRRTEVATVMLFDRVLGLFTLVLLPLLFAPVLPQVIGGADVLRGLLLSSAAAGAGMLMVIVLLASTRISERGLVAVVLQRLPLGRYVGKILDTIHVYRQSPGTLLAALGASVVGQGITIAVMLVLAQAINPSASAWSMAVLIPFGLLANSLPLTPGGLGVGEAAFSGLFAIAGLSGGAELVLSWRLALLVVGLLGLGVYLQGRKQFVYAPAPASARNQVVASS
jgi:uncharacterized protein (TIRG00374 family)